MSAKKKTPGRLTGFGPNDKNEIRSIRNSGLPGDSSTNAPFEKPDSEEYAIRNSGLPGNSSTDAPLNLGNVQVHIFTGENEPDTTTKETLTCPSCKRDFSDPSTENQNTRSGFYTGKIMGRNRTKQKTVICPHCAHIFLIENE